MMGSNAHDGDKAKGAVAIDAFPGLGKTTSVLAFAKQFHQREIAEQGPITPTDDQWWPVCQVGLTGNTGLKDFNRAMLEFFAHPGTAQGTASLFATRAGLHEQLPRPAADRRRPALPSVAQHLLRRRRLPPIPDASVS